MLRLYYNNNKPFPAQKIFYILYTTLHCLQKITIIIITKQQNKLMITSSVIFIFHSLTAGNNYSVLFHINCRSKSFYFYTYNCRPAWYYGRWYVGWTGDRPVPSRPLTPLSLSLRLSHLNPLPPLPPSSLVGAARASPAQNVPPFPPPF